MFVVEGKKSVFEFINSKFVLHKLFSINTSEFDMNNEKPGFAFRTQKD